MKGHSARKLEQPNWKSSARHGRKRCGELLSFWGALGVRGVNSFNRELRYVDLCTLKFLFLRRRSYFAENITGQGLRLNLGGSPGRAAVQTIPRRSHVANTSVHPPSYRYAAIIVADAIQNKERAKGSRPIKIQALRSSRRNPRQSTHPLDSTNCFGMFL